LQCACRLWLLARGSSVQGVATWALCETKRNHILGTEPASFDSLDGLDFCVQNSHLCLELVHVEHVVVDGPQVADKVGVPRMLDVMATDEVDDRRLRRKKVGGLESRVALADDEHALIAIVPVLKIAGLILIAVSHLDSFDRPGGIRTDSPSGHEEIVADVGRAIRRRDSELPVRHASDMIHGNRVEHVESLLLLPVEHVLPQQVAVWIHLVCITGEKEWIVVHGDEGIPVLAVLELLVV
jgi:hypothetical protein